ncbi:MAG: YwiC-like family protein [Candidatus Sulfotelmatobacter sp.]
MASQTGQIAALPNRRLGSLIAPREHGAWGLLLVPLATGGVIGVLAGGDLLPLAAFTVAALTLFWLRSPVESWLGTGLLRAQSQQERHGVGITILILAAVAGLALASLFWETRNSKELLLLGLIAGVAFAGQSLLRKLGRQTRMLSQIVGTVGLTVTAPAAYFVVTGQLDREAWALWMANLLFAGNQIHYVQLRIHSARASNFLQKFKSGRSFLLGEILLAATLAFAWYSHWLNALAALAFLPLLVRGAVWFFESPQPLLVRKLGWTELGHGVLFGVLLIAGFHLGR